MKKIILFSLLVISCFAFGQEIKLKSDIVYVDGKEFLKYQSKELGTKSIFSTLEGDNIFSMDLVRPYGPGTNDGIYTKITFFTSGKIARIDGNISRKEIISRMLEMNVFVDGKVDTDKAIDFCKRYNY